MNVIDSSCWLEYFAGTRVGDLVSQTVEDTESLIVPSITLYEVFKKLLQETDEDKALFAVAHIKQGKVVDLDADLAILAARIGKDHRLALADSLIYATARKFGCTLWTQDRHFEGLEAVKYFPKQN